MQLLLPIVYSIIFILLIRRMSFFNVKSISRTGLTVLFIVKILAGVIVWLIYTQYYSAADFQNYFADAQTLIRQLSGRANAYERLIGWDAVFEPQLFNNSRIMIVLNAILLLFSFGNFYVHIVFFCFLSFVGLTALYKTFIGFYPEKNIQLIISIFLIPSVLFWSSAVSKESMIICITGMVIYTSNFGLKINYSLPKIATLVILLVLLAFVKIYVAIVLIPLLLANWIISKTSTKNIVLKYAVVLASVCFLAFILKWVNPGYNVFKIIADRQAKAVSEAKGGVFLVNDKNFIYIDYNRRTETLVTLPGSGFKIKNGSAYLSWKLNNMADTTFVKNANDTATYFLCYTILPANTYLNIKRIKPEVLDFIIASPEAILNTLFQPTLFNVKSWLHLAVAIENMWLIVILFLAIIFFDKTIIRSKGTVLFSLLFAFILFALIGITTPVIGSMVRYRTIGLLFFIPMVLLAIDEKKIRKWLLRLQNP